MTCVANLAGPAALARDGYVLLRRSFRYSLLQENPVTDPFVRPNSQEDEATFREAREKTSRFPSGEKHVRVVLAMEASEGLNAQEKLSMS